MKLSTYKGSLEALTKFWGDALPSKRAYFGWERTFQINRYSIRLNKLLKRKPRPQRFVAVGYRDHGTCQEVHLDGSPTWQEVASQSLVGQKFNRNPAWDADYQRLQIFLRQEGKIVDC